MRLSCGRQCVRVLFLAAALGALGFLARRVMAPDPHLPPRFSPDPPPSASIRIQGFNYFANVDAQTVLNIRADRLIVAKKKVGALRFALIKQAHLDNAVIEMQADFSPHPNGAAATGPGPDGNAPPSPAADAGPKGAFSLPLFTLQSLKGVGNVHLAPVVMTIRQTGGPSATIRADRATIRPRAQGMVFSGGVALHSGAAALYADQMVFNMADGQIEVPGHCRIQTPQVSAPQERFRGNVWLDQQGG